MSIRENTTSLEEILAAVNALPDAGNGGGGTISTTYTGNVTITAAASIWEIPIEDTDGLVAVYCQTSLDPITDCTYANGTQVITSFFFTMNDTKFYYTKTSGHPIIGQYCAWGGYVSNATISTTDTGVSVNTGSISYTNTYKAWNIIAIYNK